MVTTRVVKVTIRVVMVTTRVTMVTTRVVMGTTRVANVICERSLTTGVAHPLHNERDLSAPEFDVLK